MSATAQQSDADEAPSDDAADNRSKAERLRSYLAEQVAQQGECYVKGKFIADDVGLSPKEIGQLMVKLQESATDIEIEKWSYTNATTWRIASGTTA